MIRKQICSGKQIKDGFMVLDFSGFSMFPFMRPGDRLICRLAETDKTPLQLGDIVLFSPHTDIGIPALTAHRIVAINGSDRFVTKGDNLPLPDRRIMKQAEIEGRGIMIIRNGRMLSLTRGLLGRSAKWIARLSLKNMTPGLVAHRLKRICRTC